MGLVVALVLFSQVAFEMSFDNFYPDKDRLHYLTVQWNINNQEDADEGRIINAPFAPTMYQEMEEVIAGTVMSGWVNDSELTLGERIVAGKVVTADSLFFQTFGFPVIAGDIASMGEPFVLFVSETFAKQTFGNEDPLGKLLLMEEDSYTIGGVFKDIPKNCHLQFDVVRTFQTYYEWGRRPGWQNNDGYLGYVRLAQGADARAVEAKIPDMMRRHYDVDAEIKKGTNRIYFLRPATDVHTKNPEVRRTCLILSILAFVLLFAGGMNYVLITISTLAKRAKSIGVHKCNGASDKHVFWMFMYETLILILVSLLAAFILIAAFRGRIETLIKADLSAIFTLSNLWVTGLVLLILFITTGVIPARIFSSIPITQIFHTYADSKKGWKKGLLFVQFTGITFMLSLLVIIVFQYNMMLNKDMGFTTENVVFSGNMWEMSKEQLQTAKTELERLPIIESVTLTYSLPADGLNGSPVIDSDTKEDMFTGRMLAADNAYIQTFGMTLLEGRTFRGNNEASDEIIVNEKLIRSMGWDSGVGKRIDYLGQTRVICGVIKDYQTQSFYHEIPPVIILPSHQYLPANRIVARLNAPLMTTILSELTEKLQAVSHDEKSMFLSYKDTYDWYYRDARLFRDSVLIAALIMLVISLLGLFGFVEDEIMRRTKEIAIRKVNGAMVKDILYILSKGITFIALPAIILGATGSFLVGSEWLQQFVVRIPLHVTLFVLCGLAILSVLQICVVTRSLPVAVSNPVNYLKTE